MAAKKKAPEAAPPRPPPPKSTKTESLACARVAADEGRFAEALAALVDAWQVAPAPELADAITRIGAVFDAEAAPLGGRTAKEREAAFQAAAAENRPERLGSLLAIVTETKGSAETRARLEALTSRVSDPRLAARIGAMITSPPYNASVGRTLAFWKYLFAVVPTLGDPRLRELARDLPRTWAADASLSDLEREALNKRLSKVLPALEALQAPTLSPDELALIAGVVTATSTKAAPAARAREGRARSEADLLQDVYEHPDDDAPRLVYADFLQEKGDPRGELIALQFRRRDGKLSRDEARREKDLLAEHGRRWLGAIEPRVKRQGTVFERGFLAACGAGSVDESWEWNTVHTLVGTAPYADGQHMASLRTIEELSGVRGLSQIERPLGVTSLHWKGPYLEGGTWRHPKPVFREDEVAEFVRIRCLPQLRRLAIDGWNAWCLPDVDAALCGWIWQSPATASLEELSIRGALARLAEWRAIAEGRRLRRIEVDARTDNGDGLALALERKRNDEEDEPGQLSRLVISGEPRTRPYYNVGTTIEGGTLTHVVEAIDALPIDALVDVVLAPSRKWQPTEAETQVLVSALKRQRRWTGALLAPT